MVNPSDASSKLFSCKKTTMLNCVYVMYITGYEVKNKPDGETATCCFADQRFETRGGS